MFAVKIYESADVANCTANLPLTLRVNGIDSWDVKPGDILRVVGLKYAIVAISDAGFDPSKRYTEAAVKSAVVRYAGEVGDLTGWMVHCRQLPGGRWASYMVNILRGALNHIATADTELGAMQDANITLGKLEISI